MHTCMNIKKLTCPFDVLKAEAESGWRISSLKILFATVRHYPVVDFFSQLISVYIIHIHVKRATARSHEVVTLVSQTGREICL